MPSVLTAIVGFPEEHVLRTGDETEVKALRARWDFLEVLARPGRNRVSLARPVPQLRGGA